MYIDHIQQLKTIETNLISAKSFMEVLDEINSIKK